MMIVRWATRVGSWQPSEVEWTRAASLIQPEEKERIGKFFFKRDAKSSMIGRLLIRKFLTLSTGLNNAEIKVERDEKGKPVFPDDSSVIFNVSHQGDFAVLAGMSGCLPGQLLGVDVMKLEYSGGKSLSEFFRIMTRNFSNKEWSSIRHPSNETDQLREFCRHWSLKESYVKATGTGITVNLQDLSFETSSSLCTTVLSDTKLFKQEEKLDGWTFEESLLDDEHCVSVARNFNSASSGFEILSVGDLLSLDGFISPPDNDYTARFLSKNEKP